MLTFHALFLDQYSKLMNEEVERLMESLTTNNALPDFPAYKHRIGMIEGLKRALELAQEADAIANGRTEQGE